MKRSITVWMAGVVALVCAASVCAHHSGSMYSPSPVWISGTVVRFDAVNPHTVTAIEARSADGQIRQWAVEGPGRDQINRLAVDRYVPQVGDAISFCAFPYKSADELSRLFPDADFSRSRAAAADASLPRYVAGHVMIVPGGELQLWEPHGLIGACIQSSDAPRETWLAFIDSDPRVRDGWCTQRTYAVVQSNAELRETVEEVNASLDSPCR